MIQITKPTHIFIILQLFALSFLTPGTLAQSADEETPPPDFFIEAEVDNLSPYVGQQVTYSLKRYQATEFPNQPHYEDHPFDGFWDTPLIQRPTYTATIAGREYKIHPTHIALFPNRPGPITLNPARLIIPGDGSKADITLESEAISLQVQPLPPNAPSNFKGAVGQFEISTRFNTTEGRVNESLTLIVEIEGFGNIETLTQPTLPKLRHWRFFEGEVTTNVLLAKERVKGSRQFEWSVVPGQAGEPEFPPVSFSYFDPQSGAYQTIHTNPIALTIKPDSAGNAAPPPLPAGNQQQVRRLASDIRHIKPVPVTLSATVETSILPYPRLFWACVILPLLAIGSAWGWQRWRRHYLADTPQARRRRARATARKLLSTAHQPNANPYIVVKNALTGYLSDKLQRHLTGLTADQLTQQLNQAGLDPQRIERVHALLARADAGRFAPATDEQTSTRSLVASTRVLIDDLEKRLDV